MSTPRIDLSRKPKKSEMKDGNNDHIIDSPHQIFSMVSSSMLPT
jgi:hypothetical protein